VKLNTRTKLSAQLVTLRAQAQALGQDLALHRHYLDKNQQLDLEQQVLKELLLES